ncbi:hypothetical protein AVEN_171776-1 [Araneus ventricosus]|uniref:Uncharacterized protein n=1 Tax=Araneus ventricosus TaxID=182803 RepID=A0A4Y2R528_ARAVE|nr:hypothetical protein AVEN_171776-1 [Araneus ventricosus]
MVGNPIPLNIHRVWGLVHAKSRVVAIRPPAGVVRKIEERLPAQMSFSYLTAVENDEVRNGSRVCPTGESRFARQGARSPRQGARPAVLGDECNEIGLKFSPDYYLSTTVEYPIEIFSPMGGGGHSIPDGGGLFPPLAPSLDEVLPKIAFVLLRNGTLM